MRFLKLQLLFFLLVIQYFAKATSPLIHPWCTAKDSALKEQRKYLHDYVFYMITKTGDTPYCWKETYARGSGEVLGTSCNVHKLEYSGGLCYKQCNDESFAQKRTSEEGKIKNPYISKKATEGSTLQWMGVGAFCLRCPSNSTATAGIPGTCNFKIGEVGFCNNDKNDWASSGSLRPACIPKASFGRGVGKLVCGQRNVKGDPTAVVTLEQSGALCYPKCDGRFTGVGPVCWKKCQAPQSTDCGMGCAVSKKQCAVDTAAMVIAPTSMAFKIASFAIPGFMAIDAVVKLGTLGSTSVSNIALHGAALVANAASAVSAEHAKNVLKTNPKWMQDLIADLEQQRGFNKDKATKYIHHVVKTVIYEINGAAMGYLLTRSIRNNPEAIAQILSIVDPVGIVSVALAFKKPLCHDTQSAPNFITGIKANPKGDAPKDGGAPGSVLHFKINVDSLPTNAELDAYQPWLRVTSTDKDWKMPTTEETKETETALRADTTMNPNPPAVIQNAPPPTDTPPEAAPLPPSYSAPDGPN